MPVADGGLQPVAGSRNMAAYTLPVIVKTGEVVLGGRVVLFGSNGVPVARPRVLRRAEAVMVDAAQGCRRVFCGGIRPLPCNFCARHCSRQDGRWRGPVLPPSGMRSRFVAVAGRLF